LRQKNPEPPQNKKNVKKCVVDCLRFLYLILFCAHVLLDCPRKHFLENEISKNYACLTHQEILSSVARWFVFKPKIPIWENFGGPLNGKYWHIL
jgi:hypothetical protein